MSRSSVIFALIHKKIDCIWTDRTLVRLDVVVVLFVLSVEKIRKVNVLSGLLGQFLPVIVFRVHKPVQIRFHHLVVLLYFSDL